MKRDMELVRDILLVIEELDSDGNGCDGNDLIANLTEKNEEYDKIIIGHLFIMKEAGLVGFAHMETFGGSIITSAIKMPWSGHEFLDDIRDQHVWEKVKSKVGNRDSISFAVIKAIVIEISKSFLK